jgi:P-type conjugative transfer protein TrbJ
MRKSLFLATLVYTIGVFPTGPAHPQLAVVCPTCDQLWEQALSYGKQVEQAATQLQQLQTELQQYANMVRNSIAIPMQLFSEVQSAISQVQNISNMAGLLAGNSAGIIERLNSLQSAGYQISSTGQSLASLPQQLTIWQNTIGNSAKQLGSALGLQQTDLGSQTAIQAAIQQHSQSAAGQLQAIQAGNEMAANNAFLLHQIAQTLISTAQANQTTADVAADRQASEDAAMLHFSTLQSTPTTGAQGF